MKYRQRCNIRPGVDIFFRWHDKHVLSSLSENKAIGLERLKKKKKELGNSPGVITGNRILVLIFTISLRIGMYMEFP